MSVKREVIMESIKRINCRLQKIDKILDANPLSEIIEGRQKAQEILQKHGNDYETISELIKPLADKEKELFKLAKLQQDSCKLIDDKCKLLNELGHLQNELFFLNEREKRNDAR